MSRAPATTKHRPIRPVKKVHHQLPAPPQGPDRPTEFKALERPDPVHAVEPRSAPTEGFEEVFNSARSGQLIARLERATRDVQIAKRLLRRRVRRLFVLIPVERHD